MAITYLDEKPRVTYLDEEKPASRVTYLEPPPTQAPAPVLLPKRAAPGIVPLGPPLAIEPTVLPGEGLADKFYPRSKFGPIVQPEIPGFGELAWEAANMSPFATPPVRADDPAMRAALTMIAPHLMPEIPAAGINLAKGFGEFLTSPVGMATGYAGAVGSPFVKALIGAIFGGTLAKGGAEQLGEASVTGDVQTGLEGAGTAAFAPFAAFGGRNRGEKPAPTVDFGKAEVPEPGASVEPVTKKPVEATGDLQHLVALKVLTPEEAGLVAKVRSTGEQQKEIGLTDTAITQTEAASLVLPTPKLAEPVKPVVIEDLNKPQNVPVVGPITLAGEPMKVGPVSTEEVLRQHEAVGVEPAVEQIRQQQAAEAEAARLRNEADLLAKQEREAQAVPVEPTAKPIAPVPLTLPAHGQVVTKQEKEVIPSGKEKGQEEGLQVAPTERVVTAPSVLSGDRGKDVEALALKAAKEPTGREAFSPEETEFMDRLSDAEYAQWQKRYAKILFQRRQQGLETTPPGEETAGPLKRSLRAYTPGTKPAELTPTVTLMKEVLGGEHPFPKDRMGNLPSASITKLADGDLFDVYQRLASRVQTLRKQLHPDVGGTHDAMARLNSTWTTLEGRFKAEAEKRGLNLMKTDKLETMPPGFESRERELRGPFYLSSVELATDPARMGFKDLNQPLDAQQVRGRIRNKIPSTEWEMVKDALPEKGRITPGEAAKLLQENGPRVEVRTLGEGVEEGRYRQLNEQHAQVVHQLDTIDPNWRQQALTDAYKDPREQIRILRKREYEARIAIEENQSRESRQMTPQSHWSSISPKPESEMKGYVEIAVVKPPKGSSYDRQGQMQTMEEGAQFPSTHSFPPNTLAFARGYMEGDTFHVVEVQSDWAQKVRNENQQISQVGLTPPEITSNRRGSDMTSGDPLLAHYERLALKAAVDHARKQGAKRIAVQDAESAMMTEGHDRLARYEEVHREYWDRMISERSEKEILSQKYPPDRYLIEGPLNEGLSGKVYFKVSDKTKPSVKQEPGMRLHYGGKSYMLVGKDGELIERFPTAEDALAYARFNRIAIGPKEASITRGKLVDLLSELTGDKGERVSFGEHKMAFTEPLRTYQERMQMEGGGPRQTRTDLIFRNPDGTPKTDASAMSFSLEKAKTPFSLLGSDKPAKTGLETSVPDVSKVAAPHLEELTQMGLHKEGSLVEGQNALDVANQIAANPKFFSAKHAALARHMIENYPQVLMDYPVLFDDAGIGRAYMDPMPGSQRIGLAAEVKTSGTMVQRFFHEASHAIVHWQLLNPVTAEQKMAVARITDVMNQALEKMPENVRRFYEDEWKPAALRNVTNEEWSPVIDSLREKGINYDEWGQLFHALNGLSEWGAMTLESTRGDRFQKWLNSWNYRDSGLSAWQTIWHEIKRLFGTVPGTALDATLDSILQLGGSDSPVAWRTKEGWRVGDRAAMVAPLAALERSTMEPMTAPPPPPSAAPSVKKSDLREKVRAKANQFAGYSLPRIFAASKDAANAGIRYASARIAAPLVARSLATQALGKHYKSAEFNRVLGDVLIEDRLRAIKDGWLDAAKNEPDPVKKKEFLDTANDVRTLIGLPGHALPTEAQYQSLLRNAEIQGAIDRHKRLIMPLAESQQVTVGGKLARPGPATDAFVNLMAVFAPDSVEGTKAMVYGSRRGDITNPLRRGSVFSKQAKGTAEVYERSYRTMVERMIRGNYEQARLREFYTTLERDGLAVEAKPGVKPPEGTRKLTIEIRGGGPGMTRQRNLWVRDNVYNEVRHALAVDDPLLRSSAGRMFAQAVTELQVVGATDAAYHTANMFAAILTAPGGKNIGVDLLRKIPGVNIVDAGARIVHNIRRVVMDSPEVQKELATMAEVGAGRAEPSHSTYLGKGLEKLGTAVGGEKWGKRAQWLDPSKSSSKFIKLVDKAGRLSLNHMYENLVTRGLAENSVEARREFINRMGQYNERLMPRLDAWLRAANISSFVVAGKNFNRLAFQRFLADSGVMAEGGVNSKAWWGLRAQDALGSIIAVGVTAYLVNKAITGTPWGRPGTPAGAIDTGKDDDRGRPIVVDPLQLTLWRRALRISGVQAAYRGMAENLGGKRTAQEIKNEVLNGLIHPYAGPVVRTTSAGLTGYDVSGYLMSRNPDDPVENLIAATKNANPMVASYFRGVAEAAEDERSEKGWKEVGRSLLSSTGLMKKGRTPTLEQEIVTRKGAVPPLGTKERRDVTKEIQTERKERGPGDELARRSMAIRTHWRNFGEEDTLRKLVAPDVRAFLDKHQLRLSAFRDELVAGGVREPMTHEETQRYEQIVVEKYNERIRKFIPYLPKERAKQQEALNLRLSLARNRARSILRSESRSKR